MNTEQVVKFLTEANTQTLIQIAKQLAKSNTDVANDLEFMLSDRKSTRLNSSHTDISRVPSSA